jgi:drug/metabolite transporter (DMT)-like permease
MGFPLWMALARATPVEGWRLEDRAGALGGDRAGRRRRARRGPATPRGLTDAASGLRHERRAGRDRGRGRGRARRDRRARRALWLALLLVVIWGANFTVQKAIFQALSPGGFLFLRYLVMPAAPRSCSAGGTACTGRRSRAPMPSLLLRLGLIGHLLHVGLVTYGIHWSTAFSSSLILACGPIFTLFILHWHGHEKLTRGQVAGVAVACCGVLAFLSDKLSGGTGGPAAATSCCSSPRRSSPTTRSRPKPLIERLGGVTVMTYAVMFGSVPIVLVTLPAGLAVAWSEIAPAIWAGTFYAVLVSAFFGWLAWGWVNMVRGVARPRR